MRDIPLSRVPNQQLNVTLSGQRWSLTLKVGQHVMFADVHRNDDVILLGQRLVAGTPLLPFGYLAGEGNFWFLTENDELPWWQRFGLDQLLVYAAPGEFDA
jgi:hypothetical protein